MANSSDIIIKFPEVTSDKENTSNPVVILLGWIGCQDKYLQKYSKIYENRGWITIRCGTTVKNVFIDKVGMSNVAQRIVKSICDNNLEDRPLFLHVLSNGGAILLEHVLLFLKRTVKSIALKGVIFDSTPGHFRFNKLFIVLQELFSKPPIIGPLFAVVFFGLLFVIFTWQFSFYYKIKEKIFGYTPGSFPYRTILNEEIKFPLLIFYSKKDHLILPEDVEYFANYREKLGAKVTKICFDDSDHVKHYKKHPEIYVNSIEQFTNECLRLDSKL